MGLVAREMSLENELDSEEVEDVDVTHVNELPPEVLSKILEHLPQKELIVNRSVCSYWREVIDEDCTMSVKIEDKSQYNSQMRFVGIQKEKFLDRKLELRMRDCRIRILDRKTPRNMKFAHPQSIRSIKVDLSVHVEDLHRLMTQVKPNVQVLSLYPYNFKEEFLSAPLTFPRLRELRIGKDSSYISGVKLYFHTLFSHTFPLLRNLHLSMCFFEDWKNMDELYQLFFKFLSKNLKRIKELTGAIDFRSQFGFDGIDFHFPDAFELSNEVGSLLYSGHMQLDFLHVQIKPRYSSPWTRFIQSQKSLTQLKVECETEAGDDEGFGIDFNLILPVIQTSIRTLRKVHLRDVLSVYGFTWIPFDISVFRDVIGLQEFKLHAREPYHWYKSWKDHQLLDDEENEDEHDAVAINFREIPIANLKVLEIDNFVCESVDLQWLVDNALQLEHLTLYRVQSRTPATSTGVHGGIIQGFVQKGNKKCIEVDSINLSYPDENAKLEAVKLEYPPRPRRYYGGCNARVIRNNEYFHDF